jgi:bifunctional UDP-N-acetylglucosamine pyrophosphorylase/glucosamine-1-phosphate N-acetyltransferase
MNVVILAAGQGKRMRSDLPKVLHRLGGRPLLAHVLDTARELGAAKICVVYGHGGEAVREALGADDIAWAKQEPQLGTGHAVLQALPHLDPEQPTLVLYGDVPLIGTATLARLHEIAAGGLGVLTVEMDDPAGYGRIVREDGEIRRIVEERDASNEECTISEVNTGFVAAPTQALARWLSGLGNDNAQGEYYLTDIVALAIGEGMPVATTQPDEAWEVLGVNSKVQLAELERIHQFNNALLLMEQGVTLADPDRLDVRGELDCGRDVTIDVNCVFSGRVVLGDGVEVGAHCVLKDARVGAGTRIAPFSHIEDAEIGPACVVGPYARLRPGTKLGEDVHIGNFVEVKNSTVADHSKANHLAYVGDASVGRNVNIGAGTITCNYDGANKHRTVIEDDAFIGSDSQLVAPVTVGRGATLGAGTTLTQDAPPDKLTITRVKQTTVPGWKRPTKKKPV